MAQLPVPLPPESRGRKPQAISMDVESSVVSPRSPIKRTRHDIEFKKWVAYSPKVPRLPFCQDLTSDVARCFRNKNYRLLPTDALQLHQVKSPDSREG